MARTERVALLAAIAIGLAAAWPVRAEAPARPATGTQRGAGERSLDQIVIEGRVQGPEVLFINAREPARLELSYGWRLLAAAGLLDPGLPAPRELESRLPGAPRAPILPGHEPQPVNEE